MSKELIEALLPINCAYNYKEEYRDETTTMGKCYSKTCMLNQNLYAEPKQVCRK